MCGHDQQNQSFIRFDAIAVRLCLALFSMGLACQLNSAVQAQPDQRVFRTDVFPFQDGVSDDKAYLKGLRDRRLYDLAVEYCNRRLGESDLSAMHRAAIAIEQVKTYTSQAMFSAASERQTFWEAIDVAVDNFRKTAPIGSGPPPRFFLVQVQQALAHMTHANLLGQELAAELIPSNQSVRAIEELRIARKLLSQLEQDIKKAVPERRNPKTEGQLNAEELLALSSNVRFQLAKCNLIRAQLYQDDPSGRLGKVDALGQAQKQLVEVVRSVSPGEPLWWETRIARVQCLRLLGRIREANILLAESADEELPPGVGLQLLEEKLRVAIDARDRRGLEKLMMMVNAPNNEFAPSATFELAVLKAALTLSLVADRSEQKQLWISEATRRTERIESQHGKYWGRRAEILLVKTVGGSNTKADPSAIKPAASNSSEVDLLIRVGNDAFRKKRYADALNAFDSALIKATEQGNVSALLPLQIQAGQTLEKLGKHRDAADRMISSAIRFTKNPASSSAHLRGCWNFAQFVSAQTSGSEGYIQARTAFQNYLEQHVQTWPDAATTGQAAIWLGDSYSGSNQFELATFAYLRVPITDKKLTVCLGRVATVAKNFLDSKSKLDRQSTLKKINSVLEHKQMETGGSEQTRRATQLVQTHLELLFAKDVVSRKPSKEVPTGETLREIAIAIQTFDKLTNSPSSESILQRVSLEPVLATVDRYLQAEISRRPDATDRLTKFRLATATRAMVIANGDASMQTSWRLKKVDSLMLLQQFQPALDELKTLEAQFPRKAEIKMKLARSMTRAYGTSDPEKAMAKWRAIAVRLKPGSDNWWEAKWNVIRLLRTSGKTKEASKLIRYLKITPGWEGAKLESEFDSLMQKLDAID